MRSVSCEERNIFLARAREERNRRQARPSSALDNPPPRCTRHGAATARPRTGQGRKARARRTRINSSSPGMGGGVWGVRNCKYRANPTTGAHSARREKVYRTGALQFDSSSRLFSASSVAPSATSSRTDGGGLAAASRGDASVPPLRGDVARRRANEGS